MIVSEKQHGMPIKILLVEDNQSHADLIMRTFEDNRVANEIHHISNGEAALDFLFQRGDYDDPEKSPRPELVLLDLRLRRVDGFEVLRKIRDSDELEDLPVVIVTTSEAEKDRAKAYAYKMHGYLIKPIEFEKIRQLLDGLGFYWLCIT